MKITVVAARLCVLSLCILPVSAIADVMRGNVTDPANSPIAGAHVSAVNRVGVFTETVTDTAGDFELNVPDVNTFHLVISASGFAIKTVNATDSTKIHM